MKSEKSQDQMFTPAKYSQLSKRQVRHDSDCRYIQMSPTTSGCRRNAHQQITIKLVLLIQQYIPLFRIHNGIRRANHRAHLTNIEFTIAKWRHSGLSMSRYAWITVKYRICHFQVNITIDSRRKTTNFQNTVAHSQNTSICSKFLFTLHTTAKISFSTHSNSNSRANKFLCNLKLKYFKFYIALAVNTISFQLQTSSNN